MNKHLKMKFNPPNVLTTIRVFLIPLFMLVFYIPKSLLSWDTINQLAAAIFIFAAITDWLDGYIARKYNYVTDFGAFLDPIADKLLIVVSLVILVKEGRTLAFLSIILICREICMGALREWMATRETAHLIPVSLVAKYKTAIQMIAITTLLFHKVPYYGYDVTIIGNILLFIAVVLSVYSFYDYLVQINNKKMN